MKPLSTGRVVTLPSIQQKNKKIDYNKLLNPYVRKLSINALIKLRTKNLTELSQKKFVQMESEALQQQKNTKFYYNELTPNRNLNGFNIHNFLTKKKLKSYCEKFILFDRQTFIDNDEKSFRNFKQGINTYLKDEIE